jgi:hypothetical protein
VNFTTNSVLGGAMTGGIIGVAYGILTAPSAPDKREDATHYGVLLAAVGAVLGGILAAPPVVIATPSA